MTARTIRRYSVELWQDLALLDVRKYTFQHLTVNWNLNVLEMALKTLHFVQGLSRTPLLFIPRYLTNIFYKHILRKDKISIIENLKIQKPRFTTVPTLTKDGTLTFQDRFLRFSYFRFFEISSICKIYSEKCW